MEIMRKFDVPVPKGGMAESVADAEKVYKSVIGDGKDCVIKAMVLTGASFRSRRHLFPLFCRSCFYPSIPSFPSGGRGLGHFSNGFKGGVHICSKPGDVSRIASKMLGSNLITKQTTKEGMPCSKVMLVERMYVRREMYISIMLDRAAGGPIFIASPAGGTSIEDVAEATPELIFKQPVDIMTGITDAQSTFLATSLGFEPGSSGHKECKSVVEKLYKMFRAHDCTLLEVGYMARRPPPSYLPNLPTHPRHTRARPLPVLPVCVRMQVNPLAETPEGRVVVCDAKLNFDDNAEFRQKDVFGYRDRSQVRGGGRGIAVKNVPLTSCCVLFFVWWWTCDVCDVCGVQEDAREVEAAKYDLNYIGLTGNVGCMVNGAGLAMATMDILKLKGGDPANFLDVGGGATESQVQKAFELLNADKAVKAILVNIFGGIMRCDVIAMGVINAAQNIGMKKPIIIRLKGTNVEEAKKLIEASGFKMIVTDDLEDAANKAVKVADIVRQAEEVSLEVQFA
jgi:succinyl-CoA synthetase beta subunit